MSFFTKVLGGIFGGNNSNGNNNSNNNREEQTQPQSEATNAGSAKQLEAAENSNDEPVKPVKTTTTVPSQNNKSKEESKKPRKKKSKDSKDSPLPNTSATPTPASSTPVTVTPTATTPPQSADSKLPQPSNSLEGSAKKRFTNIFKRTSKNPPAESSPAAGKETTDMKIGVAPVQPHLPKDAKNRNKKPKKFKKATSLPFLRRLRSADDVFPEEFRDSTKQKQRSVVRTNKNLKPSKSVPNQHEQLQQPKKKKATKALSKSPKLALPKRDKVVKELKEQSSADTEATVEQSNCADTPDSSAPSPNDKKDETLNKDNQEPAVILDREEVNRLISELKEEDRDLPNIIHDPWLSLSELMARSNNFYSDKRARNNAAITYEKLVEYELCSFKENKAENGESKKSVSINPKIDREHFDVQTRASIGKDCTEVIDHKAQTNHPDKI